jgi:hypothetical protein
MWGGGGGDESAVSVYLSKVPAVWGTWHGATINIPCIGSMDQTDNKGAFPYTLLSGERIKNQNLDYSSL